MICVWAPSHFALQEPQPIYDSRGVRTNTKEKIIMDKLLLERQSLVMAAQRINPMFVVRCWAFVVFVFVRVLTDWRTIAAVRLQVH